MSVDLLQPVVLVVKAPNQQIADQTVECAWDWTIRKLKDHLASVYPSQPRQDQQKLIYYGRLLLDHLTLKDVLKQYDGQSTHTLHLVCSASHGNASTSSTNTPSSQTESPSMTPDTDGLRRRLPGGGHQAVSSSGATTFTAAQTGTNQTSQPAPHLGQLPHHGSFAFPAHYAQPAPFLHHAQSWPLLHHMAGGGHDQQQHAMMMQYQQMYQHMYHQQMGHYMQYWQQMYSGHTTPPSTPSTPAPTTPPPRPEVPAPAPAARARGNNNNNVVMNAGAGGAAMFDDEEEQDQDWLDWFYTGCRFAVLVMVIYFYSTIPRAIIGVMFFFFIYLYQHGWFENQRRPPAPVAIPAPAPPAPAPQPAPAQENQADPAQGARENAETEQNADEASDGSSDDVTTDDSSATTEPETPPISRIYVTWTFVKTFFTSLLPAPPAVV